jgi:hypothetical protein
MQAKAIPVSKNMSSYSAEKEEAAAISLPALRSRLAPEFFRGDSPSLDAAPEPVRALLKTPRHGAAANKAPNANQAIPTQHSRPNR